MSHFSTRPSRSGATVVMPTGRLDALTAAKLREQLHDLVRAGHTRLVIDLSGTQSVDSSGLGALISGLKVARQADGDLCISAPNKQVAAVLELTSLGRILITHESADDAFSR